MKTKEEFHGELEESEELKSFVNSQTEGEIGDEDASNATGGMPYKKGSPPVRSIEIP